MFFFRKNSLIFFSLSLLTFFPFTFSDLSAKYSGSRHGGRHVVGSKHQGVSHYYYRGHHHGKWGGSNWGYGSYSPYYNYSYYNRYPYYTYDKYYYPYYYYPAGYSSKIFYYSY